MTITKQKTNETEWIDIGRPGYLGRHREERYGEWDSKYGKGNWRIAWKVDGKELSFVELCAVYEEAYVQFLKRFPDVLHRLVCDAADVYDDAPSNVNSGLDYTKQETERTHVQDIAIRRAVARLGEKFGGKELIQIRHDKGIHPLSMTLSPGKVQMYDTSLIIQPELTGWWDRGTVEALYQSNKFLQVRKVRA